MSNVLATRRLSLICGGCLCFFAVAIGAFGAHALAEVLAENQRIDTFELANRYQFYHGLALFAVGLWASDASTGGLRVAIWVMLIGCVLFCGSLYGLALSNIGVLGAITPLGGVLILTAWVMLTRCCVRG